MSNARHFVKQIRSYRDGKQQYYDYSSAKKEVSMAEQKSFDHDSYQSSDSVPMRKNQKKFTLESRNCKNNELSRFYRDSNERDTEISSKKQAQYYLNCINLPSQVSMRGIYTLIEGFDVKKVSIEDNLLSNQSKQFLNLRLYFDTFKSAESFRNHYQGKILNGKFELQFQVWRGQ